MVTLLLFVELAYTRHCHQTVPLFIEGQRGAEDDAVPLDLCRGHKVRQEKQTFFGLLFSFRGAKHTKQT